MPGNILNADTGFPRFQEGQSNSDKINVIMNYLYMLLEQLRYSMGNLDEKNFSPDGLEQLQKVITEPVYIELQKAEGDIVRIGITADGLTTRMDRFGVTGYDPTKSYQKGDLVDKDGTVYRATGNVPAGSWNPNRWEEMQATEITAEAQHSELTQTVDGFTIGVSNDTDRSTIGIYSNGVLIGTTGVIMMDGMVTFTDLESDPLSRTVIDGGLISTGIVSGDRLEGEILQGNFIQGSTIQGAVVYGENGLYGPEVVSREDTEYYDAINRKYVYQQSRMDSGEITFSIVKRDVRDPYADAAGGIPDYDTVHAQGDIEELYGKIYADYEIGKLYLTTKGTYNKQLKIESGSNMSIDSILTPNKPTPTSDTTHHGLYNGIIYIGTTPTKIYGTDYCSQVRLGGTRGQVIIYAADTLSGLTADQASGVWEFLQDGIYYNGRKKIDTNWELRADGHIYFYVPDPQNPGTGSYIQVL